MNSPVDFYESPGQHRRERARLCSWNITIGNFFFHCRNVLFPVIFAVGALILRPKIMFGSPVADRFLAGLGIGVALLGETVRLLTIGFEYIHRGGKDGRVYASRLVRGGVYGVTRNPMYVGNALITLGMTIVLGSPLGYVILIPFFLFVYQAIVAAEEAYLRNKFAAEYEQYAASVNRYVPKLSHLVGLVAGMRFDWRRSIKKDLGTVAGLIMGFIFIPLWRTYHLDGIEAAKAAAIRGLGLSLAVGTLYFVLLKLKRSNRLFRGATGAQKP
jgi:protein-S-isoprenylcysteine O-methyltransferase Ste14